MAPFLSAYLSDAMCRGFSWGTHDCMLFAANWAEFITGADPAAHYRGRYDTETGAQAVLEADGGPLAAMEAALAGWSRVDALRRGDIVLARLPHHAGEVAGVATDDHKVAFLSRRGLVIWPAEVVAAWRWGAAHG